MFRHMLSIAAASVLLTQTAVAQDSMQPGPDLTFYEMQSEVVFQGATLVVLIPVPPDASPLDPSPAMDEWRAAAIRLIDATRRVAEPLGFRVVARDPRYASLSAQSGGAYYAAPDRASTGYILVAPLRRARLQEGYLTAEALEELLQDYQAPARLLAL
jgi:hypothetical protein